MLTLHRWFCVLALSITGLLLSAVHIHSSPMDRTAVGERTALDRYVHAPDTNYSFRLRARSRAMVTRLTMIDMISQSWLTTNEVNRPLWQHWLTLVKPDKVSSSTALLFISGGSHRTNPPSKAEANIILVADTNRNGRGATQQRAESADDLRG